jgi:hypothetical protein
MIVAFSDQSASGDAVATPGAPHAPIVAATIKTNAQKTNPCFMAAIPR